MVSWMAAVIQLMGLKLHDATLAVKCLLGC